MAGVVSPDSSGSGSFCPGDSPDVVDRSLGTTRRAYWRRRPVSVMEPPVVNLPVLTIQDPLAAAGAVVLDCRPPLLPVSMDIRGVDLLAGQLPAVSAGMDVLLHGREPMSRGGGGLLGLICSELGVAPLVDPGTDLEDERPTPVGSPPSAVDESMPLSATSGVDLEVVHALLDVGVLPALVTPIVDPAVGFSMTPATYPVPPVPMLSFVDSVPLGVTSPVSPAVGSPARSEALLHQVSSPASVASPGLCPYSPVLRSAPDLSPPSGLAAMDQELPWSSSLEGPFDVHQDRPTSGASPRGLDGMRGCQYHKTSYDQESGGPDFSPAHRGSATRPAALGICGCAGVSSTAQP